MKLFAIQNDPNRKYRELADIKEIIQLTNPNKVTVQEYFRKYGQESYYNEIFMSHWLTKEDENKSGETPDLPSDGNYSPVGQASRLSRGYLQVKSQGRRTKIDKLVFHWCHKAPSSVNLERINGQRSIEQYFDLLAEIKPYRSELIDAKIFEKTFTLEPFAKVL